VVDGGEAVVVPAGLLGGSVLVVTVSVLVVAVVVAVVVVVSVVVVGSVGMGSSARAAAATAPLPNSRTPVTSAIASFVGTTDSDYRPIRPFPVHATLRLVSSSAARTSRPGALRG
jgi:hypothetical protein